MPTSSVFALPWKFIARLRCYLFGHTWYALGVEPVDPQNRRPCRVCHCWYSYEQIPNGETYESPGGAIDYHYAWQNGTSWTLYYVRQKRLLATLRCIWWTFARGWITELCQDCGRPYPLWWCEDDALYNCITKSNGHGLYCLDCFDNHAEAAGKTLMWLPITFEEWIAKTSC